MRDDVGARSPNAGDVDMVRGVSRRLHVASMGV